MKESREHLIQLAELILPEEIFDFFDIVRIEANTKQVDIHLDEKHEKAEGDDFVNERLLKGYFFSYQALINVALEIQFPNDYTLYEYVRNR